MTATQEPRKVGVTGYPLTHTVSPDFQQPAFDHYGIPATYRAYPVTAEELPGFVAAFRETEWLGLNVTIPHKEAVAGLVDRCTDTAATIGAVNTLFKEGESLVGDNTDAHGFLTALRTDGETDPAGARVLLLGAGGAGRAVLVALAQAGAHHVTIANRHRERAEALLQSLTGTLNRQNCAVVDWESTALHRAAAEADVIVNTTAVGMAKGPAPGQSPLPPHVFRSSQLVFDLIYTPSITPLLRYAAAGGARTLDGLPMLVYQGAAAFERWTDKPAPLKLMMSKAQAALGI
jgi:shikimate dehydrogenase